MKLKDVSFSYMQSNLNCDDWVVGRLDRVIVKSFEDGFQFALNVLNNPDVGGWCGCGCCHTVDAVEILKGYLESKGGG